MFFEYIFQIWHKNLIEGADNAAWGGGGISSPQLGPTRWGRDHDQRQRHQADYGHPREAGTTLQPNTGSSGH